jgi:phenylacetate-CoA ligase
MPLGLHNIPEWGRPIAASLAGAYYSRLRYDSSLESRIEAAIEREGWSARQWQDWRQERLVFLLHRAATRVPFYRRHWEKRRKHGDRSTWEDLANWPVLEKSSVRATPEAFVAEDVNRARLHSESSSGTTGTPVTVWYSRSTAREWYALFEARWRRWHGVTRDDAWANLGGRLVVPQAQTVPPFWIWNGPMRQLYLSSYHLADRNVASYWEELRKHRVRYLYGYASSLYSLAVLSANEGLTACPLTVALANAEPVYAHQRAAIQQGLGCPVRETYGMTEMVLAAGECPHGTLHLWPEAGFPELLRDGTVAPADHTGGELVATGLLNPDFILVRYRLGDTLSAGCHPEGMCGCGRLLPRIDALEGRTDDLILTKDGRRIGRLDPVFKGELAVVEAQIVQESLESIRVLVVPAAGFGSSDVQHLKHAIADRLGDMHIGIEVVSAIPRGPNGKFKAVVSKLQLKSTDRINPEPTHQ